jgi:nitrite reductase/ring-hydroxylating ferredoxin subunit
MVTEYPVGIDDVPEGTCRIVSVAGREIGIFKINGSYFALANRCPHQQGPLCEGLISGTLDYEAVQGGDLAESGKLVWRHEGEIIACPWHGLEVHVPSGRVLAWGRRRARTYQVKETIDGLVVAI